MERYIAVSQSEWTAATKGGDELGRRSLFSLERASKVANDLAVLHQEPYYVVKLVLVSFHQATINVHVDQL